MQKRQKRFIRKNGRIIPISVKAEARAAREIVSSKNSGSIAKIGATAAGYAGGLYAAGRLHKYAMAKGSSKLNRIAKIGKFGVAFGAGMSIASSLVSIDKKSNDEGARVLDIGSKSKTALGHLATFAGAYGAYRIGKRFEYAGKLGKNLFKKKDLKSMVKLGAI